MTWRLHRYVSVCTFLSGGGACLLAVTITRSSVLHSSVAVVACLPCWDERGDECRQCPSHLSSRERCGNNTGWMHRCACSAKKSKSTRVFQCVRWAGDHYWSSAENHTACCGSRLARSLVDCTCPQAKPERQVLLSGCKCIVHSFQHITAAVSALLNYSQLSE